MLLIFNPDFISTIAFVIMKDFCYRKIWYTIKTYEWAYIMPTDLSYSFSDISYND